MDMKYRLSGFGAVVEDQAEIVDPLFFGDHPRDPDHVTGQGLVFFYYLGRACQVFSGYNKEVYRGLGADVTEGDHLVVLEDQLGRDIASGDFAEKTFCSHGLSSCLQALYNIVTQERLAKAQI